MFELGGNKVPGPDGFPIHFFKQFWEMIKTDLLRLCENFFHRYENLERINWANIALIPKICTPESTTDYQPISLINSTLKILSKVLSNR